MVTAGAGVSSRLHDLEQRFAALEPQLEESPVKESLSVLHALVGEAFRTAAPRAAVPSADPAEVRELFRTAPPMQGERMSPGLPEGSEAPDFTLPDAGGRPVTLSELRGGPVVLVFYPLDWSPGCSQQLELYEQESAEFDSRGATLLGISADSIYSHGAWAAVRGISFPLLSDFSPRGEVARRYGVWRDADGFSERALYVIDADGIIRYAHVSPYLHHLPDLDELLDALERVRTKKEPKS
jgi:peroxiredoxin